jgi:hypothetical protein
MGARRSDVNRRTIRLRAGTGQRSWRRMPAALLMTLALTVAGVGLSATHAQAASTPWNVWKTTTISAAKPKATFTYVVGAKTTIRFVLGDLGANYKLTLLDKSFAPITSSDRPGVQSEEIIRQLTAGTYHVVVTSPAKQYSTSPFAVKGQPLSGVAVLSHKGRVMPNGNFQLAVDLYNTTSVPQTWWAKVKFYDAHGGYLGYRSLDVWGAAVLPRTHGLAGEGVSSSPANAAPPVGWARFTVTDIRTAQRRCITDAVMPVTNFSAVVDPGNAGRSLWSGLVRNKNTIRKQAQMAVTTFDARGDVLSGHGFYTGHIAAGETQSWSASGTRVNGVNRSSITSLQYGNACENV